MATTARNYSDQETLVLQQDNDSQQLPCRGCTRDCSSYSRCDGTPWRLDKQSANGQQHPFCPG